MCDKDTCNDASCCGECEPWNCLEQQVNGILATKEDQLQGYVDDAKDAAAESKASSEASAQSAAESKEFRDEAETAASTAVAAEGVVLGVVNTLQDTADKLEQIADELGTAIAGVAVSSWFYTTVSENQTVIPVSADKNAVDVQAIYIEGNRQSPFRGFEFDKTAMIITLAEPLPLGLEIEIILGTYNSDNPNDFAHTLASDNGASLVGSSTGVTVETRLNNLDSKVDPTLRQNLGSSEGTKLVGSGLTTLDKLLRVDALQFGAHSTTEPGYETFDSSESIQNALNYAEANGGGKVFLPKGKFFCNTYTQEVVLPGDDGTAAPAFIATGNDQNISPEATNKMYAALRIPHNVKLVCEDRANTVIYGGWDVNTGPIDLNAGIGIYVERQGVAENGTVTYGLENVTIANYFIGRLVKGISFASNEGNLKVTSCGISGIFQGMDQHTWSGQVETTGCLSGDVIGGWWLQRNNTQNANNIPPYSGKNDIYLLGWTDSCPTEILTAGQLNGTWGARHNAIDVFFDTYFFKSANSATTASGGRLTNNSNNTGTIPQWKGIAGRARTVLSRYGRPINRMDIDNLKLIRQHRTPIYLSNGLGESVISHAYFEGIGLVNNTGSAVSGNLFGIDVVDPLNTSESGVGYMVTRGGIGLKNVTVSSKNQHAPLSESADRKNAFYRGTLYIPSGTLSTTQAEIDRASVWDGANTDIRYMRWAGKAFTQPLQFTIGGPTFRYAEGNFTPTLTVDGTALAGLAVARGHYKRNGNVITGGIQFSSAGAMSLPAGPVVIGGLPFTIPAGPLAYHHGMVDTYSHAAVGVNVRPLFNDGTTTINLVTDSRGSAFTASNVPGSVQLFLYLSFTMLISG